MKRYVITKSESGIRLDKFMFKLLPNAPASVVYKALRKKRVKVDGNRITDGSFRLWEGNVTEFYINDEFFEDSNIGFVPDSKIVPKFAYEDENIAILEKPSGIPSQDMPNASGFSLESGFRTVLYNRGEFKGNGAYVPSLCHRIDRNTSGLVIAAKNHEAHIIITEKIKSKEIRKFYICRVEGTPHPSSGKIRGYIGKVGRNKFEFSESNPGGYKKAALNYKVISGDGDLSHVEVELISGRTHQIRAALAYLGYPIVGDIKYGAETRKKEYQELCAYKLKFDFKTEAGNLDYLNGRVFEYGKH